jgi:hypothetical protein
MRAKFYAPEAALLIFYAFDLLTLGSAPDERRRALLEERRTKRIRAPCPHFENESPVFEPRAGGNCILPSLWNFSELLPLQIC